jgi:hypothetical protein
MGKLELRSFARHPQDRSVQKKGRVFALPEPRCGVIATLDGLVTSHRLPEALS